MEDNDEVTSFSHCLSCFGKNWDGCMQIPNKSANGLEFASKSSKKLYNNKLYNKLD